MTDPKKKLDLSAGNAILKSEKKLDLSAGNAILKKKESTDGTQANQALGSKSVQQPVKPSLVTEKQVKVQPSASSNGGKMETFTGFSKEDLGKMNQASEEKQIQEKASVFKENLQKGKEKGAVLKSANKNALKTESLFQEAYKQEPVAESTSPFFKPQPQIGLDGKEIIKEKSLLETIGIPSKEKIEQEYKNLDLDNPTPYLSASTYNRQPINGLVINKDNFINEVFNDEKLISLGIDPADFDGYLNVSGFKDDYNKKKNRGDFESGSVKNPKLNEELYKSRLLSNYINTKNDREVLKSKLQSVRGSYEGKKIPVNKNAKVFDNNVISKYTEENLPFLSQKLKERDQLNIEKYNELTQDNTGLNSLATGTKNFLKSAFNGFVDSVNKTSATVYDVLGADDLAEDLRYLNEERQLERPSERQVSFASGKVVGLNGKKYLVDEKGTVYDKDNELMVNDLLDQGSLDKILKDSKTSKEEDWFFSPQGTAVQTGSVLGDMVWQVALQATVGRVTQRSGLLTKGLSKLSIPKGTADAIIAQSSLGYAQAYQTTLKEARDAGLTDKEAEEIAGDAAQRTAVWYGITAPISPQTKAVESLFGSAEKSLIKKAVNAYKTNGKQSFISTLNNGLKQIPKKAVTFAEEGVKESVQENVQQAGESLLINAQKNLEAGKEISDETMSYDDFINTSILSFMSGGLISNLSIPSFSGNKKTQIRNLYQLSQNMDVLDANLNEMVNGKVITKEEADKVKKDAIAVSRNVTRIPKDTDPNVQLDIMRKLSEVEDLENSKKTLDKSFHPQIDVQIQEKRNEAEEIYNSSKIKEESVPEVVSEEKAIEEPTSQMSVIKPEKSSNFANLTQDEEGNAVFFHVGDAGYETIKPSSGQSTRTSNAEAAAIGKVGGVAMYYTRPEDGETMVTGPGKYAVKVPIDKVYDFNTDENNYLEEAKKRHEAENPGKAMDPNSELAYITKIAGENGYDMVVAEWGGKTRAQTTKELAPTDTQVSRGEQVTKTFDENYVSNTNKGFEQFVPNPPSEKFDSVYKKIYNNRNSQQKYDELYKLSTSNLDREGVTKLVNESDLPQEIKDEYNKVLNSRDKARRSLKYVLTKPVTVEGAPEGDYLNVGLKIGLDGDIMSAEEVKDSLPEGVEVLEETVENVKTMPEGKEVIEPTLVLKLSRKLTDAEMKQMVLDNQQIAITQMNDGVGVLHGSDIYGDFDTDYFYMPDNRKLSDVVSKEQTVEQEVEKISELFSTDINKAVDNAKAALANLLPNVRFVIHDSYDSYTKAVGDEDVESGGTYMSGTNTIHINKRAATKTTVAHEVFHALLINMVGTDVKAGEITKRMINALSKQLDNNSDLKEYLDNFIASYDENIKNEEKAAELFGYLAANYDTLPKQSQSLIKRWMEALAKMFGFKPFTDNEVVDFFNTLSEKVATGQEVTQSDVKVLETGKKIKSPVSLLQRRQVGAFDVKYTEQEKLDELIKNKLVTEPENTDFMSGNSVAITSPDDMLVGSISIDGKEIFEGGGGVFFVTKYGDVWASGNEGTANTLAGAINKSLENNNGKKGYLVLAKGSDSKLISSSSGVKSSLSILEAMLDKGLVSASDFRSAVSSAVKSFGGEISLKGSAKQLKDDVDKYFSNPKESTFQKRGDVLKKIIETIAQSKNTKLNKDKIIDFLGGDKNKGIVSKVTTENKNRNQSLSDLVAGVASEGLTKGLKVGDVYAIIEVDGEVKVKEDSHPSYPFHVVQKDGNKPILHLPKNRENGSKTITTSTGKPYSVGQVSIMSGAFNEPSGRKQTSVIANKIKAAKDNGFSDAAVSQYLQNNGYTADQVSKALMDYNKKKIERAQKADGIFLKDTNTRIKNFLGNIRRRLASARGFMPKSTFLAIEDKNSKIEVQAKMVSNTSKRFDKLLSKYQGDKEALLVDFDSYIRGDKSIVLPSEFKAVGDIMRNQIDGLSQMLIDLGALPSESAENIRQNIGSYMTRAYEVFDNKDWAKKVKQDQVDKARDFFRNEFSKIAEDVAQKEGLTKEDVLNKMVDEQINKILNKDIENGFVRSGKEGSKDLSILKQKLDIPLEIRALMGEYTDPIQNYANTVYKMANLAYNTKFLNDLKKNGMGTIFFEEGDVNKPKEFNTKISADSTKTFDPLGGLMTTKEIAAEFNKSSKVKSLANAANEFKGYEYYMKALRSVKWLKTIGSVATHGKNVFGNLDFMLSNGYLNFNEYRKSFNVIKNDLLNKGNKDLQEKLLEYTDAGIINQNVGLGEIRSMFKDGDFDKTFERRMNKPGESKISRLGRYLKSKTIGVKEGLENAYQAEDDFFKIVAYETEKRKYSEAFYGKKYENLTDTEKKDVVDYVKEIVKNTLPNYSRIPNSAKMLKVIPVAGTFISFSLESLRTSYNTVALAFTEMKSDNPKVKAIGAKRFFALTLVQGLKYGLMYYLAANGLDDEDDEESRDKKAKRFLAPWSKNSNIVITDMGEGKFSFIDFSASDPRAQVPKALNAFSSGDNFVDGLVESVKEFTSPYLSQDILFSLVTEIKDNKDSFGREIYNEYDKPVDKINKIMARVWKTFEPGTLTSIRKISESENKVNDAVGQITGYKVIDVDAQKQYYFNSKNNFEETLKAKQIYNKAFRKFEKGEVTKEELKEAYDTSNESIRGILEENKKDFDSAVYFGADPLVLSQSADDAGYSKSVVYQIESGDFEDIEDKTPLTQEEAMKKIESLRERIKSRGIKNIDEIRRKAKEGR